ncbi:MAG TPA: single-stranded DNA-binding protein [Candidatus Saccharimonadales bacterium]|nr:single-stranded DNA-binding protein [Candidatus Saccharimonadales bacterium]
MARSLNKVQLIGNLTRDPELRYTPNGNAVCSFSIATNRNWTTDNGEKREEVDFHRIIAWNKLGELCSQFLVKGRKVYVEGRLSTRNWTGQDGAQKSTTEVIINDMILLDSKGAGAGIHEEPQPSQKASAGEAKEIEDIQESVEVSEEKVVKATKKSAKSESNEDNEKSTASTKVSSEPKEEEVMPDDIPF